MFETIKFQIKFEVLYTLFYICNLISVEFNTNTAYNT